MFPTDRKYESVQMSTSISFHVSKNMDNQRKEKLDVFIFFSFFLTLFTDTFLQIENLSEQDEKQTFLGFCFIKGATVFLHYGICLMGRDLMGEMGDKRGSRNAIFSQFRALQFTVFNPNVT